MKILFLSDINNVHTKKWVKGILEAGHEILLFGLAEPKDDFYNEYKNLKIAASNFSGQYSGSSFSKLRYLKTVKELKSLYQDFKPDIVHAHYATSYGMLGAFLKHHPYLISVWGADVYDFPIKSFIHKTILKRNLSKADYIFSTSHVMAHETAKYTTKKIEVIPFGVDLEVFTPKPNVHSGAITVGIVKTLEEKYGISYLIEAFYKLHQKHPKIDKRLLIVGDGSLRNQLEQSVNKMGIANFVTFTGKVPHNEVPNYFNKMDIVVIPSILDSESFGVAAVEASACEKPVVVSNVGGLVEVVEHGVNGLVAEPKNAEDLADKIDQLIQNPQLRMKLGKNGRELAEERYDWDKCLKLQLDAYERIVNT